MRQAKPQGHQRELDKAKRSVQSSKPGVLCGMGSEVRGYRTTPSSGMLGTSGPSLLGFGFWSLLDLGIFVYT